MYSIFSKYGDKIGKTFLFTQNMCSQSLHHNLLLINRMRDENVSVLRQSEDQKGWNAKGLSPQMQ